MEYFSISLYFLNLFLNVLSNFFLIDLFPHLDLFLHIFNINKYYFPISLTLTRNILYNHHSSTNLRLFNQLNIKIYTPTFIRMPFPPKIPNNNKLIHPQISIFETIIKINYKKLLKFTPGRGAHIYLYLDVVVKWWAR